MIQIALKALKRLGLDCHRFMHLRDNRLIRYKDSFWVMVQACLCNNPIYFNCCTNFSTNSTYPWMLDTLVLDIHLHNITNIQVSELSKKFAIVYRIYFKLLSSYLNPKCSLLTTLDEIVLLKVETNNIFNFTPKL